MEAWWPSIKGPKSPILGVPRGCFVLFVPRKITQDFWDDLSKLTEEGKLGYMTSVSPNPMTYGSYVDFYTFCVHISATDEEKAEVLKAFFENSMGSYIQRFQINYGPEGEKIRYAI